MSSDALFHNNETARAARAAHALLMRDPTLALYVYYKPRRLEAFAVRPDDDDVWTLAWPERVPGNLTVDQLIYWFASRSGRVPYLT
jgi:hypothetical protein